MAERLVRVMVVALVVSGAAVLSHAAEDNIAEDNFLTNAVSSVFDKVNKVTSGEESIFIKDYNKPDTKPQDYTTDALGRKIQEPTIRTTGAIPLTKEEKAKAAADAARQAPQAPAPE